MVFSDLQALVVLVLAVAIFAMQLYCLVDVATRPARAFVSEGKRTKQFWVVVLVVAAVFGFLALPAPLGRGGLSFIGLLSAVAAIVYLVDVKPAVARHGRGSGRGAGRGGW